MADAAAIEQHRRSVIELSKPGKALATNAPHATVKNPQWFRNVAGKIEPKAARRRLHQQLLAQQRAHAPQALSERKAIVLAGPPGAGKSYTLEKVLGADESNYVRIDADDFKKALLNAALKDGSYEQYLVPETVHDLHQAGEQFFPLELASLVHEESSMLAQALRAQVIEQGTNTVVDTVLSNEQSALELGSQLKAAGYSVEVIDVEVPFELSEQRIAQRWQESYELALAKPNELGGRWVPSEYAREVFNGPDGHSRPEVAAQRLASECTAVAGFRRYRTTLAHDGQTVGPVLEVNQHRPSPTSALTDVAKSVDARAAAARDFTKGQVVPLRPRTKQPEQPRRPVKGPSRPGPGLNRGPGK